MKEEKNYSPANGYVMLTIILSLILLPILGLIMTKMFLLFIPIGLGLFLLPGFSSFHLLNPEETGESY